jgi:hypothetical protein
MSLSAEKFAELIIIGYGKKGPSFLNKQAIAALVRGRDEMRDGERLAYVNALPRHSGDTLVKVDEVAAIITGETKPDAVVPRFGKTLSAAGEVVPIPEDITPAFEEIPDPIKPKTHKKGDEGAMGRIWK